MLPYSNTIKLKDENDFYYCTFLIDNRRGQASQAGSDPHIRTCRPSVRPYFSNSSKTKQIVTARHTVGGLLSCYIIVHINKGTILAPYTNLYWKLLQESGHIP